MLKTKIKKKKSFKREKKKTHFVQKNNGLHNQEQ